MVLISHRGNINGKTDRENHPDYIDEAISLGYDVEIDVWCKKDNLYLGHDNPQYEINLKWLNNRKDKLWIHCKNHDCLVYFNTLEDMGDDYNYFWHQEDDITLTSMNFMWVYPGKQPIPNSIAVLPEWKDDDVSQCMGICSDYIKKYE